jgi:hypothetical protein
MAKWLAAAVGLLGAFAILGVTALAQQASGQTTAPSSEQAGTHVHNYGSLDSTCMRWTDQCRVCSRSGCSNIGIACQPAEVVECMERKQADDKK